MATSTTSIQDAGAPMDSMGEVDAFSALTEAANAATQDSKATTTTTTTPPATPAQQQPPAQTPPAAQTPPPEDDPVGRAVERHTSKRDYTGLDAEEVELFKNMSRQSYDKLRPIYDAYKKHGFDTKKFEELAAQLDEQRKFRYHEHPDAYTLSDEYKQAQQIAQSIETVSNFWDEQLAALRGGSKEVSVLVRDAKGYLVPSAPIPVTPQVEAEILRNIAKVAADGQAAKQELETLRSSYRSQYDEYGKVFDKVFQQIFGKHEAVLKPIADKQLEKFPSFVRHRPEVKAAAYALATLIAGAGEKNAQAATQAADKAVQEAAASAGPTKAAITAGTTDKQTGYNDAEYKNFKAEFMIQ